MAKVHYLNVGEGDCTIIQSNSGRVSVVDICGGNVDDSQHDARAEFITERAKPRGNFHMCSRVTNPVSYLRDIGVSSIFRFILSHPDMDHMDGLDYLFNTCSVGNFWDSGVRRAKPDFSVGGYSESDWNRYSNIISKNETDLTVVCPLAGAKNKYWGDDDEGGYGDCFSVVAPNADLVSQATDSEDYNDGSYVIVYRSAGGKIIIPGDSHDRTWEYILANHREAIKDAAVLIAPHHGRSSSRDHDFLNVVNPQVTLFGCAPSKNLDYNGWNARDLLYFTNNQCGNFVLEPSKTGISVYIQNGAYALKYTGTNDVTNSQGYYLLCDTVK